jgi:hypothetical protein
VTHPQVRPDLTAESFPAAVHAVRKPGMPDPSIPWLIEVARHKLADHWRRAGREQRGLRRLDGEPTRVDDPWEAAVHRIRARRPPIVTGQVNAVAAAAPGLGHREQLAELDLRGPFGLARLAEPDPRGQRSDRLRRTPWRARIRSAVALCVRSGCSQT